MQKTANEHIPLSPEELHHSTTPPDGISSNSQMSDLKKDLSPTREATTTTTKTTFANAITPISASAEISSLGAEYTKEENLNSTDTCKIDINRLDHDVSLILEQLSQMEKTMNYRGDSESETGMKTDKHIDMKDIQTLIDNFKSTILRLNLKNMLVKNELSTLKDEYRMERYMLSSKLEHFEKTLRIIQEENDAVNERNLKLIKYIKTLKNEKLKLYIAENRRLKERLEQLEGEPNGLGINRNATRVNHQQRYQSLLSPTTVSMSSTPMSIPTGLEQTSSFTESLIQSPTTNSHMLDTLGRLATEYLNHDYPGREYNQENVNDNNNL